VCKRYSPINEGEAQFNVAILDREFNDYSALELQWRQTFFGSWRHAFLFRSGGFKWRTWSTSTNGIVRPRVSYGREMRGTTYVQKVLDQPLRMTVPQISEYPFGMLNTEGIQYQVVGLNVTGVPSVITPSFIAARDDLMFGYPILPSFILTDPSVVPSSDGEGDWQDLTQPEKS